MIERFLDGIAPMLAEPVMGTRMTVLMPVDLDPFERHYRFGAMLDAELRLALAGCADGGGTLFDIGEDDDSEPEVIFTVIDIDATDMEATRAILRDHLPELGCPAGTLILHGEDRQDRYDDDIWHCDEPASVSEE
jgi:hypothetical protein